MKNGLFFSVAVFLLSTFAAWAEGPQNVSATPHNLSTTSPSEQYRSQGTSAEDEICIFCHTPHGGSMIAPLWNRDPSNMTQTYIHYNSATISEYVNSSHPGTTPNVYPESMLCLSCHDGSISMYDLLNPSNRTGGDPTYDTNLDEGLYPGAMIALFPGMGIDPVLGHGDHNDPIQADAVNDLSNDHPISFDYLQVYSDNRSAALHLWSDAEDIGIKFFGEAEGKKRVECSTCHDPHVDYYSASGNNDYQPFLRTSNSASRMCLACHIK